MDGTSGCWAAPLSLFELSVWSLGPFLEHPLLVYLGIGPARQHRDIYFRKAHIKKCFKWPNGRTKHSGNTAGALSVCGLENKKRTCKKNKNSLGIANQDRRDVLAARILTAIEKNWKRLKNVCPSCLTDVGEDGIVCYFSVFPLQTAAAMSWQAQWNAVSKSNGSWKFDLLGWKFGMKKGSFDNFSTQSDMGDVLILFPYLHADWSHLKTQSFRSIGTSTETLQTRSCFIWKVCRMSSLVFHSSGLISSSWFHVFIGRISWTYWNANSPFHIEPKYRVFFCVIDCIQGTSKGTKKILSAVPLIPWHWQVLTFPVSNHWHRVIPEPVLTSAFSHGMPMVLLLTVPRTESELNLSAQTLFLLLTRTLCCYARCWMSEM